MLGKSITFILSLFAFSCFAMNLSAIEEAQLEVAQTQGLAWLAAVDKGNYDAAWTQGSNALQLTMPQGEWVQFMNKMRKPLGSVLSRDMADIRTATNPPGAPAGDYVILIYKSSFSSKSNAQEMLILNQNSDGEWKAMSYYVQ